MPWAIDVPDGIDIRFEESMRIPRGRFVHGRCLRLRNWIRGIVDTTQPRFIVMAGHDDVTRLLLLRDFKKRSIPVLHLSDSNVFGVQRPGSLLKNALRPLYHKMVLRSCSGFMPMGVAGRAYYHLIGKENKPMFLFPYEPDYRSFEDVGSAAKDECRMRLGVDPKRYRFLYSGRLVAVKRVDVLISAFAEVADRLPEWDLLIAGDGPLRKELEQSVQPHLRSRVQFTGFLQMEELRDCYLASSVLVHPSIYEPWALVINEAAAAGLAIIATYVTGAALELVRDQVNGFLVAPGSVASLKRALLDVTDPDRLQRFQANSRRILTEWKTIADPVKGLQDAVNYYSCDLGRTGGYA
jgi:glycosyltransferase involved in cell wall biosynthesis